jgi:putative ATP-dependent endonuclease of OLD family
LKANNIKLLNTILDTSYANDSDILKHMRENKPECALKIFETAEEIKFPQYILDAIKEND